MTDVTRHPKVEIGKDEIGRPSVKVNGLELNKLIGPDVTLRHVPDHHLGHWKLTVAFVDVAPDVEVDAEIITRAQSIDDIARDIGALPKKVNMGVASGRRRGKK